MSQQFGNFFTQKAVPKGGPVMREQLSSTPLQPQTAAKPTYSKVFRWRLPDGHTEAPQTVEVVGSFTKWIRVPLHRDGMMDSWHATLHHIEGHKTHHYMLLVDGKPAADKNSDGYAIPHGPQEEQYALTTARGPRLFMLFAQAK